MVDEELEKSKLEADTEKTEIQVKITVFIVSSNSDVFFQIFFFFFFFCTNVKSKNLDNVTCTERLTVRIR